MVCVSISGGTNACAQQVLTLDECRSMALQNSNTIKMANEKEAGAEDLRKMALSQFFPKLSANGAFIWNEKSISLLSDEQKDKINNMGTSAQDAVADAVIDYVHDATGISNATVEQDFRDRIHQGSLGADLNDVGHEITSALDFDLSQIYAGAVTVSQPVYLGGKLIAAYKVAKLTRELAGIEMDSEKEKLQQQVDEAYWRVVSVKHKQLLAQEYFNLLQQLCDDVTAMAEVEVVTQGDVAKVRVKLNEAQMSLTKASNGLVLAKMLLAQRCGMPLDSEFEVEDTPTNPTNMTKPTINMNSVWENRKEMKMLRISDSVAQNAVVIARSTLLPNVVVTGGYLVSNPNLFNGFQNEFAGTFTAGVAVNIPILHPGGFYALKAAKHKRQEVAYQMEEAKEMIELQVNKVKFELDLAYKKLEQAHSDLENAEENLKLADESFAAGMCSSSDLMAAQTAWLKAESEVIDAEIEIEMGKRYLKQAMGE